MIPAFSRPGVNKQVLLAGRPAGIPKPEHFRLQEAAIPVPAERQVLLRNLYLSVDPAQRGWAADATNYSAPIPLGSVMRALGVGIVMSSNLSEVREGDIIYGWTGWQDYSVISDADILSRVRDPRVPVSAYAGALGINGMTAWLAFNRLARPSPGDTVLVSTAAGSVGSIVGQLANSRGCRALGLTGSDEKVKLCTSRFGYAAAFNYKSPTCWDVLDSTIDGVDIFFDNVGGEILDKVIRRMLTQGRVIQCGTASVASWTPQPFGLRNEREVLLRRLTWSGFVIFDHQNDFPDAINHLETLIRAGQLVYDEDIEIGLEVAPGALQRLYAGENVGKKLIFIG